MTAHRPRLLRASTLILVASLVAVAGCSDSSTGDSSESTKPTNAGATATSIPEITGEITVFAAASLTESFTELGKQFETAHPGTTVRFSFGASSGLATQLIEGAPADVFASADESTMTKVSDASDTAGEPTVFATNRLAILTEPDNPEGIADLTDLADPSLTVVLCAAEVPCGKFAAQILSNAKVSVTPKSYEENVKAVVTKVTLGEADAGIVYATDVVAAGTKASGVDIPAEQNEIATVQVASLESAPNPDGAAAFAEFVASGEARSVFDRYGFGEP